MWTPLPMYHFNALATAIVGALVYGGRAAIYRRFSVSQFWPEMNRTGATITSTLGTMAYLLAHDIDRPEMPNSGRPEANRSLRLLGAAPLPVEVDRVIRDRFSLDTFSGAYGVTEASLISWQPPGVENRPNAAGVVNDQYFDVRIFDDDDHEVPRGTDGEIVIRPKRPHVMFEGYWGRPDETVATSRNFWYHTGDIGRVDDDGFLSFVDRKADYLRRRGENIASYEVERILMGHGALADVAVHAVPSPLTEDDLKITATVKEGADGHRGGALPLVYRSPALLRAAPLHRVPRCAPAQPGRPRPEARAAHGGCDRQHLGRRGRRGSRTSVADPRRHLPDRASGGTPAPPRWSCILYAIS